MKKQFIYIGLIVLFVMLIGFSIFSFLNKDNESKEVKNPIQKSIKIIKNPTLKLQVAKEKAIKINLDDIFQVEEITQSIENEVILNAQERDLELRVRIQEQLETRMDFIYRQCKKINTKKGILKKFQKMEYEDVFLSDMEGNTLYGSNDIEDINVRTIKLEQIQKVGKYGVGFIVSDVDRQGEKRYIYVKRLTLQNLYIGVEFYATSF